AQRNSGRSFTGSFAGPFRSERRDVYQQEQQNNTDKSIGPHNLSSLIAIQAISGYRQSEALACARRAADSLQGQEPKCSNRDRRRSSPLPNMLSPTSFWADPFATERGWHFWQHHQGRLRMSQELSRHAG